jgi:curved DNA-binding protein CbpA
MLKYFRDCKTAEELKKEYFRLAKVFHPDCGGVLETMQEINAEYDKLWSVLKDKHMNAEGEEYTAKHETCETSKQYPDIINKIIHFVGVKIEICGSWVWLSGNTYAYKDIIKTLGFDWSKNKKMWYWRADEDAAWFNRKSHDINYIRSKYGSEVVHNETIAALA